MLLLKHLPLTSCGLVYPGKSWTDTFRAWEYLSWSLPLTKAEFSIHMKCLLYLQNPLFFLGFCPWLFCDCSACSSSPHSSLGLAVLQPAAPALLRCGAWGTDDGALSCPRGAHSLVCLLPTRLRLLEDRDRHTHLPPGARCTRAPTVAVAVLYAGSTSAVELDFTSGTFIAGPT